MYSIQLNTATEEGDLTVQVCYPNHEERDSLREDLEELFEEYNRRLVSSRVLFVCPLGMEQELRSHFEDLRTRVQERLLIVSHIAVAPFDHQGRLVPERIVCLKGGASRWNITDKWLVQISQECVASLVDDTDTILRAPHGYLFRKPSGREESIFVRAGNMLSQPESLAVFNHLLLRELRPECHSILIDSSTILSFALSLRSTVLYFKGLGRSLSTLSIIDFHSYDMESEFRVPNDDNYLVLISASTSGGLAKKLVEYHQASGDRIVHLLGAGSADANFRKTCICYKELELSASGLVANAGGYSSIEIATEEFLVAQGPTRPVRITKDHVNNIAKRELHRDFYRGALRFGESNREGHEPFSPFSLSTELHDSSRSRLREWVEEVLVHELPASADVLIHADDPMSEYIASCITKAVGKQLFVLSLTRIERPPERSEFESDSAVIVAIQDPGLEIFGRASIALREKKVSHRHFVLGYGFPPTLREYSRCKSDLRLAPGGAKHGWSELMVVPVGEDNLHLSLLPNGMIYSLEVLRVLSDAIGEDLARALEERRQIDSVGTENLFLPKTCGSPLRLRQGSIFVSEVPKEGVSQIAVYAMVSAALQRAREPLDLGALSSEPALRFDNNPFIRSVLDPGMFARFNDGILQASLLRAAHPSELDYSADVGLSQEFASTCVSVLKNCKNSVGDAAIEFLYAIATNKVSLRNVDQMRVSEMIGENPCLNGIWSIFTEPDEDLV